MNLEQQQLISYTPEHSSFSYLRDRIKESRLRRETYDKKFADIRRAMGVTQVKPEVTEIDLKNFIDVVGRDKKSATEELILKSVVGSSTEKSIAFEVLNQLNSRFVIEGMNTIQQKSLLEVLSNGTDEMARVTGPVAPYKYNVFRMSTWLSVSIYRCLDSSERLDCLLSSIKDGVAWSWLMYFAMFVIHKHQIGDTAIRQHIPWLKDHELLETKTIAMGRMQGLLNDGCYNLYQPLYLFLFWWIIGNEEERQEMKEWVKANTKTDQDFVRFVNVFSEKALLRKQEGCAATIWVVYTETLEPFFSKRNLVARLRDVSHLEGQTGETATELLRRIEFADNARAKGIRKSAHRR